MTKREDPSRQPRYSDPLGVYNTLPLLPPFFFQGMTARIFPLRASPFQIDVFCDTYLNFIPPELGRFRAFLPYVFLMVLDYGKLAAPVANFGWLSQYEVMFAVPVEWYKVVDGRWEFHNWTWLTPFIYVDSELSLLLGRQTYGWPKSLMRLTPSMSDWMKGPLSVVNRARVGAMVLPEMFVGASPAPRVIMDIHQEGSLLSSRIPPDFGGPLMPWIAVGNAVQTAAALMGDMMKAMTGMGVTRAQPGADPANFMKMAAMAAEMTNPYSGVMKFNTINLKQFRDSRQPENYCYQALTNAPMTLKQFNAGGLLGDLNQMAGDASGGFRIDLHEWPGYPIVETLGLEVSRSWRGEGVEVQQLEPVFPFWYDVDMIYERGIDIAWRTFDTKWHAPDGRVFDPPKTRGASLESRYNSALGVSSSQTAAGAFQFTNSTMRVLPLLAKKKELQTFLDEYLNKPLNEDTHHPVRSRFEVWGPPGKEDPFAYVYMVATTYGPMAAAEANVGAWQSESLTVYVPVRWMEEVEGRGWVLRGLGLIPAYTFTDSNQAVISGAEVLGIPMTKGVFVSPPNTWMSEEVELAANQPLLKISAEVLPAVDLGQEAKVREVISIVRGPVLPDSDTDSWARMIRSPVEILRREQKRKRCALPSGVLRDARSMALDVLANNVSWNVFTMKQFRDVEDPEVACYQSIVRIPNKIDELYDFQELEENLHVELREYPTLPIMKLLGLVGHLTKRQKGGGIVYKLVPVRPFWMRVKWRQDRGERMWHRSGSREWIGATASERDAAGDCYFNGGGAGPTLPLRTLDWLLSSGDPSDLGVLVRDSIDEELKDESPMTPEEKRAAVGAIDPQMIIESILSREWGSRDADARWRAKYRELSEQLKQRIDTSAQNQQERNVVQFFTDLKDSTQVRYHLSHMSTAYRRIDNLVTRFEEAEEAFNTVERAFNELAARKTEKDQNKVLIDQALKDLVLHIDLAIPKEYEDQHEYPAEKKRRRTLTQRIDTLLRDMMEAHLQGHAPPPDAKVAKADYDADLKKASSDLANVLVELVHMQHKENAKMDAQIVEACMQSFHKDPQQWREIIALLRAERELRRDSLLKMFSKIAKKPDFCVLREVAGPRADQVFPLKESWDSRWFLGEREEDTTGGGMAGAPTALASLEPDRAARLDLTDPIPSTEDTEGSTSTEP